MDIFLSTIKYAEKCIAHMDYPPLSSEEGFWDSDSVFLIVFVLLAITIGMIAQIKYKIPVPWHLILALIGFFGICLKIA